MIRILIIFSALFIAGCSATLPTINQHADCSILSQKNSSNETARLYQIYINSGGQLVNPVDNTELTPQQESEYLQKIFDNFENKLKSVQQANPENNKLKLTVFIHGGLNTFDDATERVDNLRNAMLSDCRYPLFVSWDSGFPGNYSDHLFLNRRGKQSEILGPLSSPFVLMEDSLRAISRIPASSYQVIFGQNKYIKKQFSSTNEDPSNEGFNIVKSGHDNGVKLLDLISIWNPLKLVTAPYVDSLGTGAWNAMLRRADLVLNKYDAIKFQSRSPTAVSKFFDAWQKDKSDQEITLIGHSMGSIIANSIISKYGKLKFSNIIFMAAACPIKDIEQVIVPYLVHPDHRQSNFYNLSLHPDRDLLENSSKIDLLPRGSLLVWIDNTFGSINSFQDRTAGYWDNIFSAKNEVFPYNIRSRIHLTQFGVNDGSPQNHGDFDNYPFWRESFWKGSTLSD